jgi:hypothetical protein
MITYTRDALILALLAFIVLMLIFPSGELFVVCLILATLYVLAAILATIVGDDK